MRSGKKTGYCKKHHCNKINGKCPLCKLQECSDCKWGNDVSGEIGMCEECSDYNKKEVKK